MKIYLAAPFSAQEHMKVIRSRMYDRHGDEREITSSWIDVKHEGLLAIEEGLEVARKYAMQDLQDILRADTLILFTCFGPSTTGAMHTELGIAMGLRKEICIVGPRTTIFQTFSLMSHYSTLELFTEFEA